MVSAMTALAQLTRSEVNLQFMRAEKYLRQGNDSAAIEQLEILAAKIPQYPAIYLREARIYDDQYNRTQRNESLSAAILLYRKYISLEPDDKKTRDVSIRLKQLEDLLHVEHFEELEEKAQKQEAALADAVPVITNTEEALRWKKETEAPIAKQTPIDAASPKTEPEPQADDTPKTEFVTAQTTEPIATTGLAKLYEIALLLPEKRVEMGSLKNVDLNGHWVSEERQPDGREMWVMDISLNANNRQKVNVSDASGIVNPPQEEEPTVLKRILNFMKTTKIVGHVEREFVNEEAIITRYDNNYNFTFTIDEDFVQSQSLYSLSKNLVASLSQYLPYGTLVSSSLRNRIDIQEKIDQRRSSFIEYHFSAKLVTPDKMKCMVTTTQRMTNENGRQRIRNGQTLTVTLYRTRSSYTHFGNYEKLPEKYSPFFVAIDDYEQGILTQFGVECEANEKEALKLMTNAALKEDDARAKAWLANYYFHEAYSESNPNSRTRRSYLKSAEYWSNNLTEAHEPQGWGIVADMLISSSTFGLPNAETQVSTSILEQALQYYMRSAEMGDAYSTYRLGHLYLVSQKPIQNYKKAEEWLLKAAESGSLEAMLDLGRLKLREKDYDAYLRYIGLAADQGLPEAWMELSDAYLQKEGSFSGLNYNYDQAMRMLQMAKIAEAEQWRLILKRKL